MDEKLKELLKELKSYRNDMVARNYPFQEISDIITRWEMNDVPKAMAPTKVKDFLDQAEKEKQELDEERDD
tara:strand:- start:1563 stop:1775 length:213 start_codon:yes stop_codon:yes gene_type:complete